MTSLNPTQWACWLSVAEFWYNTSFHTALMGSPFQALYGYPPPVHAFPQSPHTGNSAVDILLRDRTEAFVLIKENLSHVQARMKFFVDKHILDCTFEVGDNVYLRLQP